MAYEWNLYLVRHGHALPNNNAHPHDSTRPLSENGTHAVRCVAKSMQALGDVPEVILCSPYLRARQTAGIMSEVLGVTRIVETTALTPSGSPEEVLAALALLGDEKGDIMLVGHEPNISSTLCWLLTGGNPFGVVMEPGSVAKICFTSHDLRAPSELLWLVTPAMLQCLRPDRQE